MNIDELKQRLQAERIVALSADEWAGLSPAFVDVERHDTYLAGDLLIVRLDGLFAAVEQPSPAERVLRRLADEEDVKRFVRMRLEEYERMWDGCGCKIDYYA